MKITEKNLINIISFAPIVILPLMTIVLTIMLYRIHNDDLDKTIKKLETTLIESEKKSIEIKVNSIVDLIEYQNSIIVDSLKLRVKDRVDTAMEIANSLYENYKGKKSKEEIQNIIITTLRPLIWNSGESFIWILDHKGKFYLAPQYLKEKEGTYIIDFQDATGRYIIKEEIEIVKTKKEGFLWDTFTKPNDPTMKQHEQLAFVKDFGKYNWYFGSGEYLDTALKKTNEELITSISKITAQNDKYTFILNDKAQMLLNASMDLTTTLDSGKKKTVKKIMKHITKTLVDKNQEHIFYNWENPKTGKIEIKYSFVRKVSNNDWFVGSGFYESDIKSLASKQSIKIYENYNKKIQYIFILGFVLTFITLIFSFFLGFYIKKSFQKYRDKIINKNNKLSELNESLEQRVLLRTKELQKSQEELEYLATTDTLTEIHNRYSIMKILEQEMKYANYLDKPLCVVLLDIDHFKKINDTYGHDVGDDVLYKLTNIIHESLRPTEFIGRYGGEEFVIVLKDTTLEHAKLISERIRSLICEYSFKEVGQVTISLGLVEYIKGEELKAIIKRADKLLYQSKNEGRNKLSF
jgi:diguanylate cyclase (GGDEF)-like protein